MAGAISGEHWMAAAICYCHRYCTGFLQILPSTASITFANAFPTTACELAIKPIANY
jgi:hypothetical protein